MSEYAPSVMYDLGKIIYIGGGSPPAKTVEVIDLNVTSPAWRTVQSMHSLQGAVDWLNGALTILANEHRPAVKLAALEGADLVQRRRDPTGATEPPTQAELWAFRQLAHQRQLAPGKMEVTVTGPLQKTQSGFVLKVRCQEIGP